ncbi:hypothetical protein P7K49_027710, partial [Saguinus oedipus]
SVIDGVISDVTLMCHHAQAQLNRSSNCFPPSGFSQESLAIENQLTLNTSEPTST